MSYCDLEPARFWCTVEPIARKEHACCECKAPIIPGEKYLRVTCGFDGTAETYKQHLACAELCEKGCLPMGGFKEWWSDVRRDWSQNGRARRLRSDPDYSAIRKLYAVVLRRERAS